MLSTSHREILHGYSIVRACLDDTSDHAVPVGVVAWDTPNRWQRWRWLEADEEVRGIDPATRRLMQITRNQIQRWADARKVPYEPAPAEPTSAPFWKAVSEILSTAVRLDPPKAMDPMDEPEAEIESLFEAVVQPSQPQERHAQRIDSAINQALGELTDVIPSRPRVSAFGGTSEQVRRGLETERGVLLVDGVNLAAATARKDADAFVSRFLRICDAYGSRPVHIIVGYSSSPGGLNGEAHMRDWIREKLTDQVFDVVVQNAEFKKAAADAWTRLGADPQTVLSPVGDTVPLSPNSDIRHVKVDCGKRACVRRHEPLIDMVREPFQKPCTDTVRVTWAKQPRQHVAVAYLVTGVPEDVERVEFPWL